MHLNSTFHLSFPALLSSFPLSLAVTSLSCKKVTVNIFSHSNLVRYNEILGPVIGGYGKRKAFMKKV